MKYDYDLAIIGAGSAGLTAARFAAQLGARVALVEKNRLGGDCTWSGCVPSKSLLKVARLAHEMRRAHWYGLGEVEPETDFRAVMARVRAVVAEVAKEETPDVLRAAGIAVLPGSAQFLDPHTITVGEGTLSARYLIVCTGARPFLPPLGGLDGVPYLTYETIWDLDKLPEHLLVVGAGPIGCEMAQAFRRLGSVVTLLASHETLLPRDDPAASQVLSRVFADEGVDVRYKMRAERVWQDAQGIHLTAGGTEFVGDALLVATGRRPVVGGLALEKADVEYSAKGIRVDKRLRTSQRHILSAGDCTGGPQFTHYAGWQGFVAARNALLPGATKGTKGFVPWTTFTDPELAHVGLTESRARKQFGSDVMTSFWPMDAVDRARTEGDTEGFIKVVHRKSGAVLGVTIVAARAGEMISEWIVALERRLKVGDVGRAIHVYPTYSTVSTQVGSTFLVQKLLSGLSGRLVRSLTRRIR